MIPIEQIQDAWRRLEDGDAAEELRESWRQLTDTRNSIDTLVNEIVIRIDELTTARQRLDDVVAALGQRIVQLRAEQPDDDVQQKEAAK